MENITDYSEDVVKSNDVVNNKIKEALQKLRYKEEAIIDLGDTSIIIEKWFGKYNVELVDHGTRKDIAYNVGMDRLIRLVNQYAV